MGIFQKPLCRTRGFGGVKRCVEYSTVQDGPQIQLYMGLNTTINDPINIIDG